MRFSQVVGALVTLVLCGADPVTQGRSRADIVERPALSTEGRTILNSKSPPPASGLHFSFPRLSLSSITDPFVYIELQLTAETSDFQELELLPIGPDGETADPGLGRIVWTCEPRTGSSVRFDVTRIVDAWTRGLYADNGVVIRFVVEPGEAAPIGEAKNVGTISREGKWIIFTKPASITDGGRQGKTPKQPRRVTGGVTQHN